MNLPELPLRKNFDSSTEIDLSPEALRHRLERQGATPEEIEQLLRMTRHDGSANGDVCRSEDPKDS